MLRRVKYDMPFNRPRGHDISKDLRTLAADLKGANEATEFLTIVWNRCGRSRFRSGRSFSRRKNNAIDRAKDAATNREQF